MAEILLPSGDVVNVDAEYYEALKNYPWRIYETRGKRYVSRRTKDGRTLYMHRVIMSMAMGADLVSKDVVDHIDGNGLNNQISNMRVCTQRQNACNMGHHKDSGSKYIGVYYCPQCIKPYRASITFRHKRMHLGGFGSAEDAAKVRDIAAVKYFGEYAKLNFEERRPEYLEQVLGGFDPVIKASTRSCEYRGVSLQDNAWRAAITIDRTQVNLGSHRSENDAVTARDVASIMFFGVHADLNLPERRDEYLEMIRAGYDPRIKPRGPTSSRYVGVSYDKQRDTWIAYLSGGGVRKALGSFRDEADAAVQRDLAAIKMRGDDTHLNFPGKRQEFVNKIRSGYNPFPVKKVPSSEYKGVGWDKKADKWRASIRFHGKLLFLGSFDNAIDAAVQRDLAVIKLQLKKATLNFPDKRGEYVAKIDSGYDPITRPRTAGKSSKYRGVSFYPAYQKWAAAIYSEGKSIKIGYFKSEEDAAKAYDQKAKDLGKSNLNF